MKKPIISSDEAARLVPDGVVMVVNSSSGLCCPEAVLKAIGQRFVDTGHPRGLTCFHPIAAGDMFGIDGMDHLAREGLLVRVISGSYPSGPSSKPSPRIWQLINDDKIQAYNLPSGLLFHMLRESAAKRPGVLTKVGMDTCIDPRHGGGAMNRVTTERIVERVTFDGEEWLYLRAIAPNVAIIRATTADQMGNLTCEQEGAYLGALDVAMAAHNNGGTVIAQVKRIARGGSLPPQSVRVPGILVDYLVLAPEQMQTTQTLYDPAISGEIEVPVEGFDLAPWGTDKVIARRAAMALSPGQTANLGFGISALVPRILLEEGIDGAVTWAIEQGAVGGMPLLGFAFGCSANPQAIVPSPDQFTLFQGGGFDCAMLSFLQVDAEGSVNVSRLAGRPHVTAGVGGFVDITAGAKSLVFSSTFTASGLKVAIEDGRVRIVEEGKVKKFVQKVEHVTFSGRRARESGQEVLYVTERCVLRLDPEGLTVIELAPGVDLQRDVLAQADLPLEVASDLRPMDPRIFLPQAMGMQLSGER